MMSPSTQSQESSEAALAEVVEECRHQVDRLRELLHAMTSSRIARQFHHNRNARDHSFSFLDDQLLIRRFRFHSVDDTGGPVQRDGIDLCCWTDSKVKP